MAFYWKGNALFTRKLQLPEDQCTSDTAFVLDYRNTTTTLPNLLSVSQFLATSLTFVALQNIEFWIDDYKILHLQKKTSPSAEVALSRDVETTTKERLMKVQSVERASAQIDASFMSAIGWKPEVPTAAKSEAYGFGSSEMPSLRSFFSRLTANTSTSKASKTAREEKAAQETISEDITMLSTSSIFLRVTTAAIKTSVSANFSAELERATKKPPPRVTKLSILTSSYDETQASESSAKSKAVSKATDVFASVLPSKKGGRIFIGFPTTQTTGAGIHISAPSVIPTVEREAIDLNARWVRTWNIEMLRAAGIMTRLAFTNEMIELENKLQRAGVLSGAGITSKEIAKYMPEALHTLNAFTFGDSTPSGHVSQIIEEAFWTSYKNPYVEVYSSRGVLPTNKVRIGSPELAKFVEGIPVIPPELEAIGFIQKLTDFDLLSPITVDDVRLELSGKPLNKEQLINFIQWAGKKAVQGELDPPSKDRLLDVAVGLVSEGAEDQGGIIALGSVQNYLSPNKIPAGLPVPPSTIPYDFTRNSNSNELQALGWTSLDVVPWVRFLIETNSTRPDSQNMTKSPEFSIRILTVLSKTWDNLSVSSKGTVTTLLQSHTIMPTKSGMKKPTESFFQSVKLFDDLPTIEGCSSLKDKFLTAIGVRKTVDLDTIFTRLLNRSTETEDPGRAKWSHVELIKYLASVRQDIPNDDLRKLKESRICPAEAGQPGLESITPSKQLYKVSELYEPRSPLRPLNVKIIQWPGGSIRAGSPEGKFLTDLGLRAYPSVVELVGMMASSDSTLRSNAMNYFISYHHSNNYANVDIGSAPKAFLPLQGNAQKLVTPSQCYTNEAAAILGFNILKRDLHPHAPKFGVRADPPIADCVDRLLANPPKTHQEAVALFGYFSTRLNELGNISILKLRDALIVPVVRGNRLSTSLASTSAGSKVKQEIHLSPRHCYLGSSILYGEIFDFVDFGSSANAFLSACGSKTEPTKLEIAQLAASEPARLLSVLQSPEKYLNLLKTLAEDMSTLKRDKELWKKMKSSPFLLAFKEISATSSKDKTSENEEEEMSIRQYQLATPASIVILDDYISYRMFKDHLVCAPEEDVLENFYMALGSQTLSVIVQVQLKVGSHSEKQDLAVWLRKHVLERSKLFIHEYTRYSRDAIKHDAKWLENNLSVEAVRSVSLRRSLRDSQSHTEKRSAASQKEKNGWVLYVAAESGRPDMYQVGYAVCQLILNRPSQQAYFFFEPFLKLDLLDLRSRGYNVDRILRAKAAEARIAEEERRQALDAEQAKIKEREEEFKRHRQAMGMERDRHNKTPPMKVPGAFDSPGEDDKALAPPPSQNKKPKGIFSNLSRRFGFDTSDEADESLKNMMGSNPEPVKLPPDEGSRPGKNDEGKVTNPAIVQQNLLNAVKSTRAHDSSQLYAPPSTREVKEQATYCDDTIGKDLYFVADASNGMRVFVSNNIPGFNAANFLTTNHSAINSFASLLLIVGAVYSINRSAIHIFYEPGGNTIAFNRDGSIFCNLRFYNQLHGDHTSGEAKASAAVWWWVVLAHELAHNLVHPHNADHSYYTESFIQEYFPRMMMKVTELIGARSVMAPSGPSSSSRQIEGRPLAPNPTNPSALFGEPSRLIQPMTPDPPAASSSRSAQQPPPPYER
ncbi:uncharacterized protein GGS22DRAFT_165574 [Annulohypoxylon maeteangense]|uniref:uncharacterized protein n=1 Tax=Annulohypoxylon maeteangense TaxID=1927788 RepID=UPI002008BC01|nr:uncharacterized protein GGS22DRAFT_165574 [Annulohypoxylon maeteangense]KAI0884419.1 hypothetical protein GGS22DRAFT_165574 [Annulohypoxylon maeteangense]